MSTVVIYHASCADGFGAAYALWRKYPDAQFISARYGENSYSNAVFQIKGDIAEMEVFVVDFSFPRADMDVLFASAGRVVWLDHHKTAFEAYNLTPTRYLSSADPNWQWPDHEVVLDNYRSGALIAWEYINPGAPVPTLFKMLDDYDRWQFKIDNSKEVQKAIWSYAPWTFQQWSEFVKESSVNNLIVQGAAILRAHNQNVESAIYGGKLNCWITTPPMPEYRPVKTYDATSDMFIMRGLAVNCPPAQTSDVGHLLAKESGTYGLCWFLGKDNKVKCSLRSNGDYDVSAIAKAFGGGGHKNAAGFSISMDILLEWLE